MSNEKHQLGVGHRLRSDPTPAMGAAMNSELAYARFVAEGLSYADLAHCLMLKEEGLIPEAAAKGLLAALMELHELGETAWSSGLTAGDIYDHRDAWLKARLGKLSGWLHTARARREAITLGWLVGLRADVATTRQAIFNLVEAMLEVCERHAATLMPDFTYLQHAHPTTLGHYLLGFVYPLIRDEKRLAAASEVLQGSPAGSVSTNGSRLKINRERMRELLGFESLVEHNRDAMWQPDLPISIMAVLVSVHTTIDRMAEEFLLWCTHEFSFMELSDAHCRTSVIMPQKKNPYSLAHLRGKARTMPGRLVAVVTTNLTPTGQVDNRTAAYDVVPQSLKETSSSLNLMAEVVTLAEFKVERMAEAAGFGFGWATELVEYLVETEGVDARTAHSLVGGMVAELKDGQGAEVYLAAFRAAYERENGRSWDGDAGELARVFDAREIVKARLTKGSCGQEPMRRMLSDVESWLLSGRPALLEMERKWERSRQDLLRQVTDLLHNEVYTSYEQY
jgi:argininosuccinate lyase